MARRGSKGRPRKPGPRTKNGRLSKATKKYPELRDLGTDEVQAKRQALVGDGADATLSATAIGIIFARRTELFLVAPDGTCEFEREHYDAALDYRRMRCALYGPPWPTHTTGGEASEERLAAMKERFDRKVAALTEEQKQVVASVCVFDEIPVWFDAKLLKLHLLPEDVAAQQALMDGLRSLAQSTPAEKLAAMERSRAERREGDTKPMPSIRVKGRSYDP